MESELGLLREKINIATEEYYAFYDVNYYMESVQIQNDYEARLDYLYDKICEYTNEYRSLKIV